MPEIPGSKPTTDIAWAEASGNVLEPGGGTKAAGWQSGAVHPSNFENWLRRETSRYVNYLADVTLRKFTNVSDAVAALDPGDNFQLQPGALDYQLGDSAQFATIATALDLVCADGRAVYGGQGARVYAHDPRTGANLWIQTANIGLTSAVAMSTDGAIVAVIRSPGAGNEVAVLDARTGAILVEIDAPSWTGDVVCCSDNNDPRILYSQSDDVYQWTQSGGVLELVPASADGFVRGICVEGGVFHTLTGTLTTSSAMSVRTYRLNAPYTQLGTTALGHTALYGAICTDGAAIYVAHQDTASDLRVQRISRKHWLGAPESWDLSYTQGSTTPIWSLTCRVDDRYLYVTSGDDTVLILDKVNGAVVEVISGLPITSIDTDGQFLYAVRGNADILKFNTARGASLWSVSGDGDVVTNATYGIRRAPFFKRASPLTRLA